MLRRTAIAIALGHLLISAGCQSDLPETPEGFDPASPAEGCLGKCDGGNENGRLAALPRATLATRFAPYEDALAFDRTLIATVTAARAADPSTYAEGVNPYRIRYAVYNLRNLAISTALADAADAGVDIQILIEADQLAADRTWNTTDEMLIARGFEFAPSHRDLSAEDRITADLVGIAGSGLMHLKARLYEWRDADTQVAERRLVTGSMNPGDLAVQNDETLHLIDNPALFDAYARKYDAVLEGRKLTNTWTSDAPVQVLFSPDRGVQIRDKMAELIDAEQELIVLAVYSLRNIAPTSGGDGILDRLVAAHARGVTVAVVTDRKQSDGIDANGNRVYWNDDSEDLLRDAGIPVFEVINHFSPFNAMHAKYGVFGLTRPIVVSDAGNWTRAGLGSGGRAPRNDESVLFIDSNALDGGATARRYLGNFLDIIRRYGVNGTDGQSPTGGVDPSAFFDTLTGITAWPTVAVSYSTTAQTFWGQSLWVTGSLPELGNWTRNESFGWPLGTDGASYPVWTSNALVLPFGERAETKLVKRSDSSVQWQYGPNSVLIADPTDMRMIGEAAPSTELDIELAW